MTSASLIHSLRLYVTQHRFVFEAPANADGADTTEIIFTHA